MIWHGWSKNFKNITFIKKLVNTCWPNCIKLQSYCFQNTWLLLQISLNGRDIVFFSVSWNCFFFEYFLLRFDSSNLLMKSTFESGSWKSVKRNQLDLKKVTIKIVAQFVYCSNRCIFEKMSNPEVAPFNPPNPRRIEGGNILHHK